MKTIKISAPGKLHLLGEHIVVYGNPAIIAAVNKRCAVTITLRNDTVIEIISKELNIQTNTNFQEVMQITQLAQETWKNFCSTNNSALLKELTKDPLTYPKIIIGETINYLTNSHSERSGNEAEESNTTTLIKPSANEVFTKFGGMRSTTGTRTFARRLKSAKALVRMTKKKMNKIAGFTLSIASDIPIGSGMGSSAALAISIASAVSILITCSLDKEAVNTIAYAAEQKKHGYPSGGDNSVSCYGGLVWFRKETADIKVIQPIPFSLPSIIRDKFFMVNTGIPSESTADMVTMVRKGYLEVQNRYDGIFSDQEMLVRNLSDALHAENVPEIIKILQAGEKNLEKLGVVSPSAQKLIREIEKHGGAAKICGGGGKTKATGIVLGFHEEPEKLKEKLQIELPFEQVELGVEGVRLEH